MCGAVGGVMAMTKGRTSRETRAQVTFSILYKIVTRRVGMEPPPAAAASDVGDAWGEEEKMAKYLKPQDEVAEDRERYRRVRRGSCRVSDAGVFSAYHTYLFQRRGS